MAGAVSTLAARTAAPHAGRNLTEPRWVQGMAITVALAFLGLFLVVPLAAVFIQAFAKGWEVYRQAVTDEMAFAAIRLTLLVLAIVIPFNTLFGLAAAWYLTRFPTRTKTLVVTLIDLPFSVSPVIAGMVFVLLFGSHGWFGPWLIDHGIKVIFAVPGIVLATLFVTFPFVARELIPVMESQGAEEEQAALVLGASGWTIFRRITIPKIKWGLLYGVILCSARAMGEFGAVSVVSGHIRGLTNTIPLHVEILYNEYNFAAAFAVASLLALSAIVTLAAKAAVQRRFRAEIEKPSAEEAS